MIDSLLAFGGLAYAYRKIRLLEKERAALAAELRRVTTERDQWAELAKQQSDILDTGRELVAKQGAVIRAYQGQIEQLPEPEWERSKWN